MLVVVWLGTVVFAVLTWPGAADGFRHELGVVLTGIACTIAIRAFATFKRDHRDPVFSLIANSSWLIYLGLTIVLALASATQLPTGVLVAFHAANLGVALALRALTARVHVDNATRRAEKASMQDLQSATARLKLNAGAWPSGDQRAAIDATLESMLEAIRYAPGRVMPEFEQVVTDAVTAVDTTAARLRAAEEKPAEWYLAEVRACERFVDGQLAHLQGQMSARRA